MTSSDNVAGSMAPARRGGGHAHGRLRLDTRSLRQLYVSMPAPALRTLQEAFLLEASLAESRLVEAFCTRHLALIASVLTEKQLRREQRAQAKAKKKA
jgi:hypothetical protein